MINDTTGFITSVKTGWITSEKSTGITKTGGITFMRVHRSV